MQPAISTFIQIMGTYIILSFFLGPILFYYAFGRKLSSAGNGYVFGSVLSLILWYYKGSKMI